MGYRATAWAYDLPLIGAQKFILVALADMADEADSCYPGQKRLARMTGFSVRTVQRALEDLERHGLIARQRRYGDGGYRTSDRYKLNLDVQMLDTLGDTVSHDTESGDSESGDTVSSLGDIDDDLRRHSVVAKNHQLTTREPSGGTPFCGKHPSGTDRACRACGDARRAYDAQLHSKTDTKTTRRDIEADVRSAKARGLINREHPAHEPLPEYVAQQLADARRRDAILEERAG